MHTANRLLTDEECRAVERHLASFVSSWAAHGTPLKAVFGILPIKWRWPWMKRAGGHGPQHRCLVAVARRQRSASFVGRPGFVRSGMVVHAPAQPDVTWQTTKLHEFWAMRKAGILRDESLVGHDLTTLGDLRTQGVKPLAIHGTPRCGEGRQTSCFQACSCPLLCPSVSCDVFSR